MDLLDLIKNRRTIREYKNEKIPQEIIEKIIDAARWAPSAHNLQPWKFVVIENSDKINQIAKVLEEKSNELFSGFNIVMKEAAKNLRKTNLLLAVYSNSTITKKFNRFGPPYTDIGIIYEIQSISNAIENMLLYGYSLDLGMAWYGMALFCEKEINDLLEQKGRLMTILSLGYPAENPVSSSRKKVSEITEFIR